MFKFILFFAPVLISIFDSAERKIPVPYTNHPINPKFANPNFVEDRWRIHLPEPTAPQYWYYNFPKNYTPPTPPPFPGFHNPLYDDKCNPANCRQYYNPVCGLNRANMQFQLFDSMCNLILNNLCVRVFGNLKYDPVKLDNCHKFIYRTDACPSSCPEDVEPVCALSHMDGHLVAFRNDCFLNKRNCDPGRLVNEYSETSPELCTELLENALQ